MLNIMEGTIEVHHVSLIKFIPFVVCKGHSRTIKLLTVQTHTFSTCIHSLHVLQSTIERFPDSHLADRVGHLSHGNMLAVQGRI